MHGLPRQIAVVAAALFNVGLNALAGAGLLFGADTGAVSDGHPTGVTPAGWAFSIWSVIFLGVLALAVWQAAPARRGERYDGIGVPFVLANVLCGLWQIPWLLQWFGTAALVIVGITGSLAWLYLRLDRMTLRGPERWALGVPTALFLAWLIVATSLNLTIWLTTLGWTSDAVVWPVGLVLAVAAIGAAVLARTGDVAFAAVIVWAFAAIAARQGGTALPAALAVGAGLVTAAAAWAVWRGQTPFPTAHAR